MIGWMPGTYIIERLNAVEPFGREGQVRRARSLILGATGFDMAVLNRRAGRGLLATINRGTVKLIGNKNYSGQYALAA